VPLVRGGGSGLLRYDDLVCKHWPELKATDAAKGQLTVAHLLRHEAGLPALPPGVHLTTELLHDLSRLAQFMAEQPLASAPGSRRAYHAVTAGFLLNELCRRVDPQRRTVGQLIHQDIATPLNVPYFVGQGSPPPVTANVEQHHVEQHKQPPVLYALLHVWLVRSRASFLGVWVGLWVCVRALGHRPPHRPLRPPRCHLRRRPVHLMVIGVC
jgi:CubicO group peptidase (beta-lactamase class C family)